LLSFIIINNVIEIKKKYRDGIDFERMLNIRKTKQTGLILLGPLRGNSVA
jgi:hypothetical protein